MLKEQKKHIDKEQGKTKYEATRSVNYRAAHNKNNIGTTALERSVVYTTGGLKTFHCTNFTLGADIILNTKNTKKYIKRSVRIMAFLLNQCISAKTQNQIDHCDETKKEYSWLIPHCKPELKETTS